MHLDDREETIAWGTTAIELELERSLELATAAGLEEHAGRAFVSLT